MTAPIGCTDNGCIFAALRAPGGMGTNGGCKCFSDLESWNEAAGRWNREEVRQVRRWTQALVKRLRDAEKDRDVYKAECASISAEFGLPPTMRPREGEIARMRDEWKKCRERVLVLEEGLRGVVGICGLNCDEESNCGVCAVALRALRGEA